MLSTTVTDNGQITLPDEIRQYLNLISGSRIEFIIDESGQVKIFPLTVAVETLSGLLYRPHTSPATQEGIDAAIAEGANASCYQLKPPPLCIEEERGLSLVQLPQS